MAESDPNHVVEDGGGVVRYWSMPNAENVLAIGRVDCRPEWIDRRRWAESEPGWRSVPSLYCLLMADEGGTEITETEAFDVIRRWKTRDVGI
jgi:hypothetical protein